MILAWSDLLIIIKKFPSKTTLFSGADEKLKELEIFSKEYKPAKYNSNSKLNDDELSKLRNIIIKNLHLTKEDSPARNAYLEIILLLHPQMNNQDIPLAEDKLQAILNVLRLLEKGNFEITTDLVSWVIKASNSNLINYYFNLANVSNKLTSLEKTLLLLEKNNALDVNYINLFLPMFLSSSGSLILENLRWGSDKQFLISDYLSDEKNSFSEHRGFIEFIQVVNSNIIQDETNPYIEQIKKFNQILKTYMELGGKLSFAGAGEKNVKDINTFFNMLFKHGVLSPEVLNKILLSTKRRLDESANLNLICKVDKLFAAGKAADSWDSEYLSFITKNFKTVFNKVSNFSGTFYDFTKDYIEPLIKLANAHLLTLENFNIVHSKAMTEINENDISKKTDLLVILNKKHILNEYTKNVIKNHNNPKRLRRIIKLLSITDPIADQFTLTLDNLNLILQHEEILDQNDFFVRFTMYRFTQTHFDHLIAICNANPGNPEEASVQIYHYTNQQLGYHDQLNQHQPVQDEINYKQSTHNKKVHESVSLSALALSEHYKEKINSREKLDKIIEEIKTWAEKLLDQGPLNLEHQKYTKEQAIKLSYIPIDEKKAVAKRAIQQRDKNILDNGIQDIDFMDKMSGVSMKEMLALYWIAGHDVEKMNEGRADIKITWENRAEECFIDALYETQREYCFDEIVTEIKKSDGSIKEVTDEYEFGGIDSHSCTGGTFNKFTEKFCTIHPLISLEFSSKDLAKTKLNTIVPKALREHLENMLMSKPLDLEEFHKELNLLKELDDEMWKGIIKTVTVGMSDFKNLFENEAEFLIYVENGKYVNGLNDIFDEFTKKATAIPIADSEQKIKMSKEEVQKDVLIEKDQDLEPQEGEVKKDNLSQIINLQEEKITFQDDEELFKNAINGITDYLKLDGKHLGFFARNFDSDRGKARAEYYKNELSDQNIAPLTKLIILYALLSAEDGKKLQSYVVNALGYTDRFVALFAVKEKLLKRPEIVNHKQGIESAVHLSNISVGEIVSHANTLSEAKICDKSKLADGKTSIPITFVRH